MKVPVWAITCCALLLVTLVTPARAQLTTEEIAQQTLAAASSCARYRVTGVCFFLKCVLFKCSVKTSVRVQHFSPDLVVSLYHDQSTHPWEFGRTVAKATSRAGASIGRSLLDSAGTRYKATRTSANVMYRDADAIGNPANVLRLLLSGSMPSLDSPSSIPMPTAIELAKFFQQAPAQIANQWSSIPDSYGGGQGATAKSQVDVQSILGSAGGQMSQLTSGLGKAGGVLNLGDEQSSSTGGAGNGRSGGSGSGAGGGSSINFFCPPGATPFGLYFDSNLDVMSWRGFWQLEQLYPATWLPGMREIGAGLQQSWGSVHPRQGSLVQQNPVKGSAVLAQRIADIVGQPAQPHIYAPLNLTPGGYVWFGDQGIRENDGNHTRWQRLYPHAETSCTVFGGNDSLSPTSYGDGHNTAERGVVFNLWRRQECCQRLTSIFLGSIAIPN